MDLIDSITVREGGGEREVQLPVGDLTRLDANDGVDVLIVSAFPDDYAPTPTSLIGKLHAVGVNVADLARDKARAGPDPASISGQKAETHFRRLAPLLLAQASNSDPRGIVRL
jgi:hypothetical protein